MHELWQAIYGIYLEIAPYIFIGLTFAGLMHVLIKGNFIVDQLGKADIWSIIKAAILGIPLPLCSCGVVPTAMHLKRKGASNGATISFLTSTPQTGIDSIIPTFGMLGWFIGIYRPVTALIMGILTGAATNKFMLDEHPDEIEKTAQSCCLNCDCDDPNCTHPSHPWNRQQSSGYTCSCSTNESNLQDHEHNPHLKGARSGNIFVRFARYAYGDFIDDISTQLLVGIIIAGLITWLIPDGFFEQYGGKGLLGMIFMIIVGLPMYVCATGSIPIAVSLIMKGISPGAAFVFLVVGPATNAASLTVIASSLGKKVTAVYVCILTLGALVFGLLLNFFVVEFGILIEVKHHSNLMERTIILDIITVIFSIILLLSFWRKYIPHKRKAKEEEKGESPMQRYKVEDMHCNHCVNAVQSVIDDLSGVKTVKINLSDKLVEVDGNMSEHQVIEAVKGIGYKIEVLKEEL